MTNRPLLLAALLLSACAGQTPAPAPAPETAAAPAAAPAETVRRYTVLMSTNKAGTQVVTERGGEVITDFEYNDRGRGPKTHSVERFDASSIPQSIVTTGNDYLKQAVDERLTTEGGVVRWKNGAEGGEAPAGAFYVGMYSAYEDVAALVRAALHAGGSLATLPGGSVTVRKVGDADLHGTHVNAYELSGLAFEPMEVWLDDQQNFFAVPSSWMTVIREGFEADEKQLIEAQDARAASRTAELTKRLAHVPAAHRLIVTNARIFDPRTLTLSVPQTIVVEGNRIVSVGGPSERNAADLIDADGSVVLPGLWDMHQHLGSVDAMLDIACGITSARDLGNDPDSLIAMRDKIDAGTEIGPRIVMAGLVDGPGPFHGPTKMLVDNEDEGKKAIDFFVAHGYEGLKIYSSVRPELVPFLTQYAHQHHLRVSGHVPAGMTASQAVDAGYDEIQHVNMLFLNFMADVKDTRTPARFTEVAKRGADLDLGSPEVKAFIEKLRAHGTVSDPTVSVFEGMFLARAGEPSPEIAPIADRLPVQVRRGFAAGGLPIPDDATRARYAASFQKMLDLIGLLHRSGVQIVAGTDALAGFALHRELENYVRAGIPAPEVLRIATLRPAQILGREKNLGTIEPGKLADFIVVPGDPTKNISDLRRVSHVVKDGVVYLPSELFPAMGIKP